MRQGRPLVDPASGRPLENDESGSGWAGPAPRHRLRIECLCSERAQSRVLPYPATLGVGSAAGVLHADLREEKSATTIQGSARGLLVHRRRRQRRIGAAAAGAADWSDTEIMLNTGSKFREPFNPFAAQDINRPWLNDTDVSKNYLTLQHASGHKLGRNFFFVDIIDSRKNDPAGGSHGEIYSEGYSALSLSKLTGAKLAFGPVADINLTGGYNWGAKSNGANPRVFLYGATVDFKLPGFIFFNVDVLAYNDKGRFDGGRQSATRPTRSRRRGCPSSASGRPTGSSPAMWTSSASAARRPAAAPAAPARSWRSRSCGWTSASTSARRKPCTWASSGTGGATSSATTA